jgi:hypothetical protein
MAARRCRALGRRRRLATRAQRRALLARDGGCARSGCEETRIERLHAHHLTPWRLGGRTDVSAMVLLCDVDHGLVHDEELTLTRPLLTLVPEHGLPDPAPAGGERMDLHHVVWALPAHRDHLRRTAA